jgi:hypothetical protein
MVGLRPALKLTFPMTHYDNAFVGVEESRDSFCIYIFDRESEERTQEEIIPKNDPEKLLTRLHWFIGWMS